MDVWSVSQWGSKPSAAVYLCCAFLAGADPTFGLDVVLPGSVLLQPPEVPETSLLQDLQTRAQSVLLLLQILQTLNLRREEHSSIGVHIKDKNI